MIIPMREEWTTRTEHEHSVEVEGLRTVCMAQKEQIENLKRDNANLKLFIEIFLAKESKVAPVQ